MGFQGSRKSRRTRFVPGFPGKRTLADQWNPFFVQVAVTREGTGGTPRARNLPLESARTTTGIHPSARGSRRIRAPGAPFPPSRRTRPWTHRPRGKGISRETGAAPILKILWIPARPGARTRRRWIPRPTPRKRKAPPGERGVVLFSKSPGPGLPGAGRISTLAPWASLEDSPGTFPKTRVPKGRERVPRKILFFSPRWGARWSPQGPPVPEGTRRTALSGVGGAGRDHSPEGPVRPGETQGTHPKEVIRRPRRARGIPRAGSPPGRRIFPSRKKGWGRRTFTCRTWPVFSGVHQMRKEGLWGRETSIRWALPSTGTPSRRKRPSPAARTHEKGLPSRRKRAFSGRAPPFWGARIRPSRTAPRGGTSERVRVWPSGRKILRSKGALPSTSRKRRAFPGGRGESRNTPGADPETRKRRETPVPSRGKVSRETRARALRGRERRRKREDGREAFHWTVWPPKKGPCQVQPGVPFQARATGSPSGRGIRARPKRKGTSLTWGGR